MLSMRQLAYISIVFTISLITAPSLIGVAILSRYMWEVTTQEVADALRAVAHSFIVAAMVTTIAVLFSIPLAWRIAKERDWLSYFLDFILDSPLFVPTAVLGFSILSFWSQGKYSLHLVSMGFWLVILLHFTFTHPYIVRTLVGVIRSTDFAPEVAARSLGARGFPLARTIYLPMIKWGIVAGALLAFARSISETGATYVVAGDFETGPVFVKNRLHEGAVGAAAVAVITLMILSILFFFIIARLSRKRFVPFYSKKKWEEYFGPKTYELVKASAIAFLAILILVPSFYLVAYISLGATCDWGQLMSSIALSSLIAGIASAFAIIFGIPLAYYLAREDGILRDAIEALVLVPIVVPTVSLGTSLGIFWGRLGLHPVLAVAMAHLSFTFPLFVESYAAAIKAVDYELELVAQSLGADTVQTFREITFPLTKGAIVSSLVLVFTRSFGETGATVAVAETIGADVNTVPLLLVRWIKMAQAGQMSFSSVAIASFVTILVGLTLMAIIKKFGE